MDKLSMFRAFEVHLQRRLAELDRSVADAAGGARLDGDRPSNRGERGAVSSQGYLAQGLGERAASLREALGVVARVPADARARVVVGCVVTIDDGVDEQTLLVLPGGDGTRLGDVTVISPESPLAVALFGRSEGDDAVVVRGGRAVHVSVVAVR